MAVRVLQVLHGMNRGGAETLVMNIYRNIDREKVQLDFIVHTNAKCDYDDEIEQLGGRIYHCPEYKIINHSSYTKWWNRFFSTHKEYKIIHSHLDSCANIHLRIAKKYGLITIAHSHSTKEGNGITAKVKTLLKKDFNSCCEYKFGCSQAANEWLYGTEAVNAGTCYVIQNGVDTSVFNINPVHRAKIREEFDLGNSLVLGHIGRMDDNKNQIFIIKLLQEMLKKGIDAKLLLVGCGVNTSVLKEYTKNNKLSDKVIFTGLRSDVDKLLNAMDIFVFPSIYEGLPVTLIEAQAAGLPCIISDTITDEVCITDLVQRISLDKSPAYWAEEVLKYQHFNSYDTSEQIKAAGFDIKGTALWLQNFYLTKSE
ncbi:MAG: glycosyltransferase family 1 protein [Clostridium sp.]|nr:glycosyltransferase family 1 protein [Clostridium sp.]